MKRRLSVVMLAVFLIVGFVLSGCSFIAKDRQAVSAGTDAYLQITDDIGRKVVVPKKPLRIVVLAPTFLDMLYGVGGKAVGRPTSKAPFQFAEAESLPDVGFTYNINTEKVLALQPDLVIAFQGMHEKLVPILESSGIPVMVLKMKTYQDVLDKIALFGAIAGTQEQSERLAAELQKKIKETASQLPEQSKKIVILHATARSIPVELDNSIAGSIAAMLKLKNIASGIQPADGESTTTPLSLEKLVQEDPDTIMVVTMGSRDTVEKRMNEDLKSNPAWASLKAVKNGQVFFLPSELFLLNPGIRYHESVEYMAKVVYPEVYGHVR